jgi:NADH-quinone oxidoreductase subunit F
MKFIAGMNSYTTLKNKSNAEWNALVDSGEPVIYLGMASCGKAAGADKVKEVILKTLTQNELSARLVEVGCIGTCYLEPLMDISAYGNPRVSFGNLDEESAEIVLTKCLIENKYYKDKILGYFGSEPFDGIPRFFDQPMLKPQVRIVTKNCGMIDPQNIYHYIANDGYLGLTKALEKSPYEIIEEITFAGLRGRGGAGFPTGIKWRTCRNTHSDEKYLICNADEGDPGAFMNRLLLESDPHAVLEGMLIAAYAIGATQGYIYIRAEYPLAIVRLQHAMKQMEESNLIGKNILGSDFSFDIKIKEGAGAFVCGEETALIQSIEGSRGMPRPRPPFPAVSGLHGKPTIINNVETLGTLPHILRNGPEWYRQFGVDKNYGTKTFSLVGKVRRSGLIEVPLGIPLRKIIFDIGGGTLKHFKAVQTGGPSGGCIPLELLDTPVTYETLSAVGSIMGSGGLIVMDEDTCVVDVARYFLDFIQKESCGKCTPCRVGTRHMVEILEKISEGNAEPEYLDKLESLAKLVKATSMCALGQSASNPVLTTLKYFREEYRRHIIDKSCDAFLCKKLVGAPCQSACPLGTEAWRYVAYLAQGEYEKAYQVIREANPLPSVCARVCDHPCESRCRAGTTGGEAIAIRSLKRFITDRIDPMSYKPQRSSVKKNEKVAIIGSGPAGLTAAHYLSLMGYSITIFEAEPQYGGMLYCAIPSYRLPREVIMQEIAAILDENITVNFNTSLGKDFSIDDLFEKEFDAVLIAIGAHKSKQLGVENEDIEGVIPSIEFLKAFNMNHKTLAKGKVGVIGGGNSAIDAARVALRQKDVESVNIIYRRTKEEMPAFEEEIEAAEQEGIVLQTLITPNKIIESDGKLKGIECLRNQLGDVDSSGRRKPVPIEGSEFILELDTLIVAISEDSGRDCISAIESSGINATSSNTVEVVLKTLQTSRQGVFAAGDVITGPNTVVQAIAAGKKSAVMIDRYLNKNSLTEPIIPTLPSVYVEPMKDTETKAAQRVATLRAPADWRKRNYAEVEVSLSAEEAKAESLRCLRCDLEFTENGDGK